MCACTHFYVPLSNPLRKGCSYTFIFITQDEKPRKQRKATWQDKKKCIRSNKNGDHGKNGGVQQTTIFTVNEFVDHFLDWWWLMLIHFIIAAPVRFSCLCTETAGSILFTFFSFWVKKFNLSTSAFLVFSICTSTWAQNVSEFATSANELLTLALQLNRSDSHVKSSVCWPQRPRAMQE